MTSPMERVPARSRTPNGPGRHATTQGTGCGYLHSAFGPGCPYCATEPKATWSDHGLCGQADPEEWFPEPGIRTIAKTICARCPVRYPCLLAALARNERWGIWGGMTTGERDDLRLGRAA